MMHAATRRVVCARHTSSMTVGTLSIRSTTAAAAAGSSASAVLNQSPLTVLPAMAHIHTQHTASYSTSRSFLFAASPAVPRKRRYADTGYWGVAPNPQLISLGDLQPREGSMKTRKRVGRGPGSGLGKTAGKGHKGQGQRKGIRKRGFEGGSTPFWRRTPKLGITNAQRYWKMLTPLSVKKIVEFIKLGRIDGSQLITMKTLYDSGCLSKIEHGVKLLSGGLEKLDQPIHIQLTDCSEQSRNLLESSGGSVHLVWFNRMTLRAHLNPVKFLKRYGRFPQHTGVPPPKKAAKYGYVVEHVDY